MSHDFRREGPRIGIETMCWETVDGREESAVAIDLSSAGLRIERPYVGGRTRRELPLQIEVPGIDEVMWAKADACFDMIVASHHPTTSSFGLIRQTGYRIALAATRDMKMLKEFVVETDRARKRAQRAQREREFNASFDFGFA